MRTVTPLAALLLTSLLHANLIENGGFEVGGPRSAAGFSTHQFEGSYEYVVATDDPHSGERCIGIIPAQEGWARWYTTDAFLLKNAKYRLSCWVRSTASATGKADGNVYLTGCGAQLSLPFGLELGWKQLSGEFTPTETGRAGLYLQSYGTGPVYFDDVALEMVAPPPAETGEPIPTDGAPLTAIVTPAEPAAHHLYLATEAQRLLQEMTGKRILIRPDDGQPAGRALYLGVPPPGSDFSADLDRLDGEGVLVDVAPDAVACLAKTPRGLNYAVYELFRLLGCRWYMPGPRGTIIPRADGLTLPRTHLVHNPSFVLRGGTIIQVEAHAPEFKLQHVDTEAYIAWAVANHMNRLKASYPDSWTYGAMRGGSWEEYAGHTYSFLVPAAKYWDTHPEYFPLVKGQRTHLHSSGRPAELCVSNPDVGRIMTEGALDYFSGHPDGMRFCVNADDEPSYWCECEACRALDTVANDFEHQGDGVLDLTDRCMTLVNKVADGVREQHPDRWIGTFAYGSTREVPRKVRPAQNVMVELCWWDRCFKHALTDSSCPVNAKGLRRLRDWQRWTPNLTLYGYLQYAHGSVPQTFFRSEGDFLRTVHRRGVRCITDEWDTDFYASALFLSLRARLLWDVDTDVEAFVKDFCGNMYGPAAKPMREYYRLTEQAVIESPQEHVSFRGLDRFTPEAVAAGERALRQASRLAPDDLTRARVTDQRYALDMVQLHQLEAKEGKSADEQVALVELNSRILTEAERHDIGIGMGARNALYVGYTPPLVALAGQRLLELPEEWQFRTDPEAVGEDEQWQLPGRVDATWKPISTHQAWEEQGYPGYDGFGWYALDVKLPAGSGGRVWLLFEAVDELCTVWLDGREVGRSEGEPGVVWDKPAAVEITGQYRPEETTHLVVRVHDSAYAGGIWKPVWVVESAR